jgi:hypothetical protein
VEIVSHTRSKTPLFLSSEEELEDDAGEEDDDDEEAAPLEIQYASPLPFSGLGDIESPLPAQPAALPSTPILAKSPTPLPTGQYRIRVLGPVITDNAESSEDSSFPHTQVRRGRGRPPSSSRRAGMGRGRGSLKGKGRADRSASPVVPELPTLSYEQLQDAVPVIEPSTVKELVRDLSDFQLVRPFSFCLFYFWF